MEQGGQYKAQYGNSPIWLDAFGCIWLDTAGQKIITYDPVTKIERVYDALGAIRALIASEDGQFIGVYKDGLYFLNFITGSKKPFVLPSELTAIHYLNAAKCAEDGRIWIGTADGFYDSFQKSSRTAFSQYPFANAKIMVIDTAGRIKPVKEHLGFVNGLAWNKENRKFYQIDASRHAIYQYEITENDDLRFGRLIYSFPMEEGAPSGVVIDALGRLWVALTKNSHVVNRTNLNSKIVCVEPETQRIVHEIICENMTVTACTIGGADLQTLFITTANILSNQESSIAGHLFSYPLPEKGVAESRYPLSDLKNSMHIFSKI